MPRAGETISPATPCSSIEVSTSFLAHRIFGGVGDERHDAGRLEDPLDADREFGEEGVGEVVDDHADDVGLRLAQIGGAAVVDVAEILDRLAHLAGGLAAGSAPLPCSTSDTVDFDTPACAGDVEIVALVDRPCAACLPISSH